jgi:hypothetical protein
MTQCAWTHVVDNPAARHLVAALVAPKAADEPAALLAGLIEGVGPAGAFALLTRCEEEGAVVLCAFTHPEDAESVAAAVGAVEMADRYPGWASCRGFTLDKTTAQAISDALETRAPPAAVRPMAVMSPA